MTPEQIAALETLTEVTDRHFPSVTLDGFDVATRLAERMVNAADARYRDWPNELAQVLALMACKLAACALNDAPERLTP